MIEIWKDVLDYEGLYQASNLGRVRSLKFGKVRILKQRKNEKGYVYVSLQTKSCRVHRLIWKAFNGKIPDGYEVNHINEDKTDNRLCNLNLMTRKENCNWGTRNIRDGETKSKRVGQFTLDGKFVREWSSTRECDRNGFDHSAVGKCCNGKLKTYKGYRWKYL